MSDFTRLQKSKEIFCNAERSEGETVGRAYALEDAAYADLFEIKKKFGDESGEIGDAEIAIAVQSEVESVFRPHHRGKSESFYRGFVSGALGVLEELNGQR